MVNLASDARARRRALICASAGALLMALASQALAAPTVDTAQPFYDENSPPLAQNPVVFEGGTFEPTTTFALTTPITLDTPGGTVDSTNGVVYLQGAVGGPGHLTIAGSNGVALSVANTYAGGTTVNSGSLLGIAGTIAALPGDVLDNGFLQFQVADAPYAGVISGSGSIQLFEGAGTLTLTGNNTASGTAFVESGNLQLGSGGSSGAWTGNIVSAGNVTFDRSNTVTYGGQITDFGTGHGSLTQAGAGTLVLTEDSNYSGGTTINSGGTIQLGDGIANGSVAGAITDNGTLKFDIKGTQDFGNDLSGSGSVEIVGGTVVSTGASQQVNGTVTIDNGATLQWGDGVSHGLLDGFSAGIDGAVVDNGTLVVDDGALSGNFAISGSGSLEIKAGLALEGPTTYTGATVIDSGAALSLALSASISQSSGVQDNGGLLDISLSNAGASIKSLSGSGSVTLGSKSLTLTAAAGAFSGDISGSGGLEISGGTETLTGTNDITGATTIDGGATLQLGDGTTNGSVAGAVTDNGTLKFDINGAQTFSNTLSGSGNIEIMAGTLVSIGPSGVANGGGSATLTIDNGATLQWGDGTSDGGVTSDVIVNNGAVVVDQVTGDDFSLGPMVMSGSGSVTVESGGLEAFHANSYTGLTTIDSGAVLALIDDGAISDSSGLVDNGTFDISQTFAGTSIKTLSGSGSVTLGSHTLTLTAASGTFSGVIADGGSGGGTGGGLRISGGTETLTNTNSFSGSTTIDTGATLVLGDGTSGHNGSVGGTISDNGLVKFDVNGSQTFSNSMVGAGSVEIVAGTVVATGQSFVSGTLTIDSGATLQWGNGSGLPYLLAGTVVDNGALDFDLGTGPGLEFVGEFVQGSGTVTVQNGNIYFDLANTYTGETTIDSGAGIFLKTAGSIADSSDLVDNGVFDISRTTSGTSIKTVSGSGFVSLGAETLTLTAATGTFDGVFADGGAGGGTGGGLDIQHGTITLTGVNTFTGLTTIEAGATLKLSGSGSIGDSEDPLVNGTFDISGASGPVSVISLSGSGQVLLGVNTLRLTGASETFSGVISGSGGLTVAAGTETLSGINTYGGATTIDPGATLALSGTGSIADSSNVNDGGTFDISQTTSGASIKSLSGPGGVDLGSETLTLTAAAGTFSGVIGDGGHGGALTISAGTETLTGANTFTGSTTIEAGATLVLGDGTAGHNGSVGGAIADDGLLQFDINGTQTVSQVINGTGSVEIEAGTLVVTKIDVLTGGGSVVTIDHSATLQWGDGTTSAALAALSVVDDGALVVDQQPGSPILLNTVVISGSGTLEVESGILTTQTTNTYTGQTTIDAGAELGLLNLGSIAQSSGVLDDGTFDVSQTTSGTSIKSLSGSGSVTLGAKTLTLTAAAETFSGDISGSGGLTLSGGTETLTGANSYTGDTTIDATATLKLSGGGSIASSAGVIDDGTFDISATTAGASIVTLSGSGSVVLGSKTLTLTGAVSAFSGDISGTGGLTIAGGEEILTGFNDYSGPTTIIGGATLAMELSGALPFSHVQDDGTLNIGIDPTFYFAEIAGLSGSGDVELVGNVLVLDDASDTFSGVISGLNSGGLWIQAGTETLTGVNTYQGATLISGTLDLAGAGSIADAFIVEDNGLFDISGTTHGASIRQLGGSGTVALGNQTLTITNGALSSSAIFFGVITGAGGLTIAGGSEGLVGVNTYTGATTIDTGATLYLGGPGSIAASSLVTDNGTFDISFTTAGAAIRDLAGSGAVSLGAQTLTITNAGHSFSGVISGAGGLTIAGGAEGLSGINTYTGATLIDSGAALKLAGGGSIAASSLVTDNGTFDISGASGGVSIKSLAGSGAVSLGGNGLTLTAAANEFSGAISGAGGLTIAAGDEILTGTNPFTGGATIGAGAILQLGHGGAIGSVASAILDNGALIFDLSAALTYGQVISGSGTVTDAGTGPLTFTASNTYAGGTTINSGARLNLGAGGTSGGVVGDITDNGTLAFNRSDTVVFGGAISGTGSLIQAGAGTVILNGINTVSGQTTVAAGTLEVGDGSHTGAVLDSHLGGVLVNAGGTLAGHGTINGAVTNNGVVSPGGTIGTLTVASYTQGSGGALNIEVSPAAASQLKVIGAASLAGTLNLNFDAGAYTPQIYTIVSAGSLTGTFSTVNRNSPPAGMVFGLGYSSNAVLLLGVPTADAQVYGEVSKATLDRAQSFASMVEDSFGAAVCASGANAPHDDCNGMRAWAQVIGSNDHVDATAGGDAFTNKGAGALGGIDKRWGEGMTLGVAFGYTENNLRVTAAHATASGRSYFLAGYGRASAGLLQLDGQGFWMKTDWPLRRGVTGFGVASSNPNGDSAGFLAQASTPLGASGLRPYVRFTYAHFGRDAVSETGVGMLGFDVKAGAANAAVGEAGFIYAPTSVSLGQAKVFPTLRLGVQQDFSSRGIPISGDLGGLAGTDFTTSYLKPGRTTGVADAAIKARVTQSFDLTGDIRGRFGGGQSEAAASVGGVIHF